MVLNLLVLRTSIPEVLKEQYELLGFKFEYHKHGTGPYHYASDMNKFVFEIYPLTAAMEKADASIRLGFDVANLDDKMKILRNSNWIVISGLKQTEWGKVAVIQDLDGRKIELKAV